jgi:hypothetical protein
MLYRSDLYFFHYHARFVILNGHGNGRNNHHHFLLISATIATKIRSLSSIDSMILFTSLRLVKHKTLNIPEQSATEYFQIIISLLNVS